MIELGANPHGTLGAHETKGGVVVRAYRPEARAVRAADSTWAADSTEHRRQIRACLARERTANIAACLQLYYGWSAERGLRANDSVRAPAR